MQSTEKVVRVVSRSQIASFLTLLIAAGVGILYFTTYTSEQRRTNCQSQCEARGMNGLSAPTGTAGRIVDGTVVVGESGSSCTCVPKP
jgi:hypothetical protein